MQNKPENKKSFTQRFNDVTDKVEPFLLPTCGYLSLLIAIALPLWGYLIKKLLLALAFSLLLFLPVGYLLIKRINPFRRKKKSN